MLGKPSHRLEKHLAECGKQASAVVVEISQHGMAITHGAEGVVSNTTLELKTKLRVEPNGEPAFEIEKRFRYGQLAVPAVGMRVPVIFDPDDHDKIMLDHGQAATMAAAIGSTISAGGSPPRDPAQLLKDVQEAQAQAGGDPQALAALLREKLGAQGAVVIDGSSGFGRPAADPLDRLEKAVQLHKEGALTDEEFAAQKAKILGES